MLSSNVTVVNARAIAAERGIEVIESRSSRPRSFANMLSVKLHTTGGERWIEGTVFEGDSPRLTQLDGVDVEAPLDGPARCSSSATRISRASSARSARFSAGTASTSGASRWGAGPGGAVGRA